MRTSEEAINTPPLVEKTMDDAPVYYSADEAIAWAAGYNRAIADLNLIIKEFNNVIR